jgi:hypothetical protein
MLVVAEVSLSLYIHCTNSMLRGRVIGERRVAITAFGADIFIARGVALKSGTIPSNDWNPTNV